MSPFLLFFNLRKLLYIIQRKPQDRAALRLQKRPAEQKTLNHRPGGHSGGAGHFSYGSGRQGQRHHCPHFTGKWDSNRTAYWHEKGIGRGSKKTQPNPYRWKNSTIRKILTQQEHCGDVINFKTYSKSFKNKTRLDNPEGNWVIIKDVHESIIDRDTFEQVQKKIIKRTKRRAPKSENGEKSTFSDLLYCADCGHKLWYHVDTTNKNICFFPAPTM